MVANLRLNLVEGRSEHYGTEPGWWFVVNQLRLWSWAAGPMLALAALGARRQPILLIVALANIAIHSLIPHKEYRFIWLSSVLLILLAGLGTAEAILWARARWPGRGRTIAAAVILCWVGVSVASAASKAGRAQWRGSGRSIALMRAEHGAAPGCGVAYYHPNGDERAAYFYFDRPAAIAFLDEPSAPDDLRRYASAFDMVVTAPDQAGALDPGYRLKTCRYGAAVSQAARQSAQACLYVRPGSCSGTIPARLDVNAAFVRERR
jgi:phosphatidylinositol glycan class B